MCSLSICCWCRCVLCVCSSDIKPDWPNYQVTWPYCLSASPPAPSCLCYVTWLDLMRFHWCSRIRFPRAAAGRLLTTLQWSCFVCFFPQHNIFLHLTTTTKIYIYITRLFTFMWKKVVARCCQSNALDQIVISTCKSKSPGVSLAQC